MTEQQQHWDKVYDSKAPDKLTWYQPSATISLDWIRSLQLPEEAQIVDMGSGCSTLVDGLLQMGHRFLTMVDLSESALKCAQKRLGERAKQLSWVATDATTWEPETTFDLWHDRAVFHFLTQKEQQDAYVEVLKKGLKPGGYLLMATFAIGGPEKCSGLPIEQYDAEKLLTTLGEGFELLREEGEMHPTPWGGEQEFTYFLLRRTQ